MEAEVVIVGGGPAGLACALHLARLYAAQGRSAENILLIEKGRALGAHQLSGAVMDPRGLRALEPEFASDPELGAIPVADDALLVLTPGPARPPPPPPPQLHPLRGVAARVEYGGASHCCTMCVSSLSLS
jgi:electron-transferring-flavoprotein dehydrogenase